MDRDLIIKCKNCGNTFCIPAGENALRCPFCDEPNDRPQSGKYLRTLLFSLCLNDDRGFILLLLAFSCQGILPSIAFSLLLTPELLGKTILLALPLVIYIIVRLHIRIFNPKDTSAYCKDSGFRPWAKVISVLFLLQKGWLIANIVELLLNSGAPLIQLTAFTYIYFIICLLCGIIAIYMNAYVVFYKTKIRVQISD